MWAAIGICLLAATDAAHSRPSRTQGAGGGDTTAVPVPASTGTSESGRTSESLGVLGQACPAAAAPEASFRRANWEAIFWIDDADAFRSAMEARGAVPKDIGVGLELTDPTGRPLRFITPPS